MSMICTEDDYRAGVIELGKLIEREDSLDRTELNHLSELADDLITWEQSNDPVAPEPISSSEPSKRGSGELVSA